MERLKRLFDFFWEKEFVRFVFAAGLNTVLGYLVTLFFKYVCGLADPWPTVLNFVLLFPLAYTMQTKIAFRAQWSLKRMFIYPLSSLPNYVLQTGCVMLFLELAKLPPYIAYALGYVCPVPVMFFIIRFIVKPMRKKGGEDKPPRS